MFHLQERQLHIILWLLFGASILLFCVMALPQKEDSVVQQTGESLSDFSEAWICDYETEDSGKLEQYLDADAIAGGQRSIREIVSFPASLPVKEGKTLVMTNKVPVISSSDVYLVLQTKGQRVEVQAGGQTIYTSSEKDRNLTTRHIIGIPARSQGENIAVLLTGGNGISLDDVKIGTFYEVLYDAFMENGIYAVLGIVLAVGAVLQILLWILIANKSYQKRILLYAGLEGLGIGSVFILESQCFQVLTGWNYSRYFIQSCMIVLTGVLHLMLMRCFVYKKKILAFMDMGILFYGIWYISVMVLQGFSLITFEWVLQAGMVLFGIMIILYTIIFFVAVYDYGRKEGRFVLIGNGILIVAVIAKLVSYVMHQEANSAWYLPVGFTLYIAMMWILGMKQATTFHPIQKERAQQESSGDVFVEKLNPNLLFAALSTLQKMIKNGSANSTKMIYYISVYLRDNLRAIEKSDEMISFEEELEHMVAYLQLQQLRNQKLHVAVECKEMNFHVPRQSMELLVEKAVKYGVAGKSDGGNVVVRSYVREDGYAVQIIDDGIGFDTGSLKRDHRNGVLAIFDLLKQKCGARSEIISKEGKGTVITMILPMLENDLIQNEFDQEIK